MDHPSANAAMGAEAYWAGVRAQYSVPPDFINLENGFFGVPSIPVQEAFARYNDLVNRDGSLFMRDHFPQRLQRVLEALAEFTGAGADELLITRNLTESFNVLLQGYPFKAGDGVVLARQDYDTVLDTLGMLASRKGLEVTRLDLPLDPVSDEQIVSLYEDAIGPNTRVLLVTHLIHRSGQIMPVAKIAAMARRRGIDVMVDAAHSFAQLDFSLPAVGADFVAANLHKWLGAPLGVGLLYIRRQRIADIAPLYGDVSHRADDIGKLGNVGTVPPGPVLAIEDAIAYHHTIGSANKEARLRWLTQYWVDKVRRLPGVSMFTPADPLRSCAIAAFGIEGIPAAQVVERLMSEWRIYTVVRAIGDADAVRVTPHLYTSTAELDKLVAAIGMLCLRRTI